MLSLYIIKFWKKYFSKYLWGFVFAFSLIGNVHSEEIEGITLHSIRVKNLLPQLIVPFEEEPKTLVLTTSDSLWNNHFFDIVIPRKDHRKFSLFINQYRDYTEAALIENTFGIYQTFEDKQLRIPAIVPLDWYREANLYENERAQIYKKFTEKITKKKKNRRSSNSRALRVNIADIGDSEVALNIRGNIDILGQVIFQDQELVNTNMKENQSWDLEIDQKQNFNIEGTVGDRVSVLVDQNSEADFSWENDILLKYEGKDDEILKSVDAGNISLSLPSTQFVTYGSGKNEGLFGLKAINQLGPLSMTTILSREQVRKSSKTKTGDEASSDITIDDFQFVKDRYFFIDVYYKNKFYPLSDDGKHFYTVNQDGEILRVITDYNIYKRVDNYQDGAISGDAYVDPSSEGDPISGLWIQLQRDIDYEINQYLGYVRMKSAVGADALGISYDLNNMDTSGNIIQIDDDPFYETYTDYDYVLSGDILFDTGPDSVFSIYENGCGGSIQDSLYTYSQIIDSLILDQTIDSIEVLNQIIWQSDLGEQVELCGPLYWEEINCLYCDRTDPNGDNYDAINNLEGAELNGELDEGELYTDNNNDGLFTLDESIRLKLLKSTGTSDPSKPTWPLMFKNVYDLGARNINMDDFELKIIHEKGPTGTEEFSPEGNSFLNIFGLDSRDLQGNYLPGGDGIIDNIGAIINPVYGELMLPFYLPFAYQEQCYDLGELGDCVYWGNNFDDLSTILDVPLNDSDNDFNDDSDSGPAMYYSTSNNSQEIQDEHDFIFNIKYAERSSTMSLGFMVVEGSEEVVVNGQTLMRNQDYIIDYFSGSITFRDTELGRMAVDPSASINVSYEENELVSFDQKLMAGTRMELDLGDKNFIGFTALYYNQTIIDDKVDIGYEPLRNFIWDINGKYSTEFDFMTRAVDMLPLIETTAPSKFTIEGEYAQVVPNPNPLGQAFLDDFESSKMTISPSIMDNHWKIASPPVDSTKDIYNRGTMYWYNPYQDIDTKEIWPNKETSSRAGNNTTKTLVLASEFTDETEWNGITTNFYEGSTNQSDKKFLEIWLNSSSVIDTNAMLHIDIGYISEDINNNGKLDSEDVPIIEGTNVGNGILDPAPDSCNDCLSPEDIGIDGCTDEYEDGYGGCLIFPDPNYAFGDDPNSDNWFYQSGSSDYSRKNGTEGNSAMEGSTYPDTEDLNGDKSPDFSNSYFTYSFKPKTDPSGEPSMDGTIPTNWKLFRILLSDFEKIQGNSVNEIEWSDVRSLRLWMDGIAGSELNRLQVAKLELVGNKWIELGQANLDSLYILNDPWVEDEAFGATVANTEENGWYSAPDDAVIEEDKVYNIKSKEQALVLDFEGNGINPEGIVAIKRSFASLPSDKKNSFFIYNKLKMHVHGMPSQNWGVDDTTVQLVFQFGLDDQNFYEVVKPISSQNQELWDNKTNYIDIDLGAISKKKEGIIALESFNEIIHDTGIDSVFSEFEDGCGGSLPTFIRSFYTYSDLIDSLLIDYNSLINYTVILDELSLLDDQIELKEQNDNFDICGNQFLNSNLNDPNGDNYDEYMNPDGTEFNLGYDIGEPFYDNNGNGILDPAPDNYDIENNIWTWMDGAGTNLEITNIRGEPSIDRINQIIIGIKNNNPINTIYGSVLINEMRFTDVKKTKGQAFRIKTDFNFADLLSVNTSFERKDSEFRTLQERLGAGTTTDKISVNSTLNPHLVLPAQWGIKTPLSINYSTNISTPKYRTGTDILVGDVNEAPDSIKSISQSISMSTSFKKTTRSDKWWLKYTLDKFTTNFSASYRKSSDLSIASNVTQDYSLNMAYSYQFSNENYWKPLKFLESTPLIGKTLGESKLFWSPKKIQTSMKFNEDTNNKLYRNGTENITEGFDLIRDYSLTYQFTNSLTSTYSKNVKSDLISIKNSPEARLEAIKNLNPGLVTNMSEQISNTLSMDKLRWLRPTITYNSKFSWALQTTDYNSSIASDNTLKSTINFNAKDFIETFYTPSNSSSSSSKSSRPGRSRNRSNSTKKSKFNIKNKYARFIINPFHIVATRLSPVSVSYTITINNAEAGLVPDQMPDYFYRFGIYSIQNEIIGSNYPFLSGIPNQENTLESWNNKISRDFTLSSGLNFVSGMVMKLNFLDKETIIKEDGNKETITRLVSLIPIGTRGNDTIPGLNQNNIPIPNWDINWTGLHKLPLLNKIFSSVTLTHAYKGELQQTETESGLQNEEYIHQYKPLIGFNFKFKGENTINFNTHLSQSLSIKNNTQTGSTERLFSNGLTGDVSYSKQGGLYIPIFFFRDFDIKNDITFKLNMSYDNSVKKTISISGESSLLENSTSLSIRPEMTYSFTRWVNGGLHFDYKFVDNLTTGQRTERDFGFSVKIKIQG